MSTTLADGHAQHRNARVPTPPTKSWDRLLTSRAIRPLEVANLSRMGTKPCAPSLLALGPTPKNNCAPSAAPRLQTRRHNFHFRPVWDGQQGNVGAARLTPKLGMRKQDLVLRRSHSRGMQHFKIQCWQQGSATFVAIGCSSPSKAHGLPSRGHTTEGNYHTWQLLAFI